MSLTILTKRVEALEHIIETKVLPDMESANIARAKMQEDVGTILAYVTGAQKVGGVIVRHGPRAAIFGAGIMTSAGFGNPKVWAFISSFFG